MANPPTPFCVAINLANSGVDPNADCTDKSCLAEVGPEAGPEVIVNIRSSVERAGVKREPMSYDIEECNKESNSHHENEEKKAKSQLS
jgi:hypothetical protein